MLSRIYDHTGYDLSQRLQRNEVLEEESPYLETIPVALNLGA